MSRCLQGAGELKNRQNPNRNIKLLKKALRAVVFYIARLVKAGRTDSLMERAFASSVLLPLCPAITLS